MNQNRDIAIDIVPVGAAADEATQAALREPAGKTAAKSERTNIFDFDRASLERFFEEGLGEKKFRAHQVMKWIHHRYVTDFAGMTDLGKAGRRLEALRIFEKLEATHAGTTIHAKAITEAGPILKGYGTSLAEAIRNHTAYMGQRAKVLTTLAPEERRKTEALQASEVTAHKAKIEAERKSGTKWLSMAAFDLEELKQQLHSDKKHALNILTGLQT